MLLIGYFILKLVRKVIFKGTTVISIKVTSKPVTDIRKLPLIKDPNTAEACMAFLALFNEGCMVSMVLYLDNPIKEVKNNELIMFHVYRNSSSLLYAATAKHAGSKNVINVIAVLEAGSVGSSGNNNNVNRIYDRFLTSHISYTTALYSYVPPQHKV